MSASPCANNVALLHGPREQQRPEGIALAIKHNGSYCLTYHRFAERRQVEACYPQFEQFLKLKTEYDPAGLFQSNWYRHYQKMFG